MDWVGCGRGGALGMWIHILSLLWLGLFTWNFVLMGYRSVGFTYYCWGVWWWEIHEGQFFAEMAHSL